MISLEEIERTILELESKDTTFANCQKLADLYIVRDALKGYSRSAAQPLSVSGDSEFLRAVDGKETAKTWLLMDELMRTIRVINPGLYDGVMRRLEG